MELGWIDFSQNDRQRVFDVMNLLREQGALDELGIGVVRDAFANEFFPGTSTIQTRAKYFLIVPYILKDAVDGKHGKDVSYILAYIDQQEKECGKRFLDNNKDEEGVIGSRVLPDGWVTTKPSNIYWNGIRTYKIFLDDKMSISEYVTLSVRMKDEKARMASGNSGDEKDADRDDRDAGDNRTLKLWNLPTWKKDWFEHLQMNLTSDEAGFLKSQIISSAESSLLSYILKNHVDVEACTDFETLTEVLSSQIDEHMASLMRLACDFSNLVYMARVRYNMILSQGQNEDAIKEWKVLYENREKNASVDLDAVFNELQLVNSNNRLTLGFLQELKKDFLEGRVEDADECIRKREKHLKSNRAKLDRPEDFDPQGWIGGRKLDYRFSSAKRIIKDIYDGEGHVNV